MNLVLDNEYQQTLEPLKERARSAQLKAAPSATEEKISSAEMTRVWRCDEPRISGR